MSLFYQAMKYYPYVFHPITVLGVSFLVLIHHEWALQDADRSTFWHRIGGFLCMGLLSLTPTGVYVVVTGRGPLKVTQGNTWQVDALVASGLFIAAGGTWYLWTRLDWGPLVPGAMEALAAVTVPYMALSPFWNVSGHVIIALMPTLYLTLVDRKFWPLLAIPAIMVPNRVIVDAHTWAQSIGALLITTVLVIGVYWFHTDKPLRPGSRSTIL